MSYEAKKTQQLRLFSALLGFTVNSGVDAYFGGGTKLTVLGKTLSLFFIKSNI